MNQTESLTPSSLLSACISPRRPGAGQNLRIGSWTCTELAHHPAPPSPRSSVRLTTAFALPAWAPQARAADSQLGCSHLEPFKQVTGRLQTIGELGAATSRRVKQLGQRAQDTVICSGNQLRFVTPNALAVPGAARSRQSTISRGCSPNRAEARPELCRHGPRFGHPRRPRPPSEAGALACTAASQDGRRGPWLR